MLCPRWQGPTRGVMGCQTSWQSHTEGLGAVSGCFAGQTGFPLAEGRSPQSYPGCPDPQSTMPQGCSLTRCFLLPSRPIAQGLLGIQDLGQVFFEPVKDKQGNILIVTLKEVKTNQTFESVRWVPICKLQTSRKSVSSPEEPTALDTLLISLQVIAGDCSGLHCGTASAPFSPWPGKAMAEPRPLRVWPWLQVGRAEPRQPAKPLLL